MQGFRGVFGFQDEEIFENGEAVDCSAIEMLKLLINIKPPDAQQLSIRSLTDFIPIHFLA